MVFSMRRTPNSMAAVACGCLLVQLFGGALAAPSLGISVDTASGAYAISVDGATWFSSVQLPVCVAGAQVALKFSAAIDASGADALGPWTGVASTYLATGQTRIVFTTHHYANQANAASATVSFPDGLDTSRCGVNTAQSTRFPAFSTSAAQAPTLGFLSWRGTALASTVSARGLSNLAQKGLDAGPVVSFNQSGTALVWSTLSSHKVVIQATAAGSYSMGLSAAIPSIPQNWNYSVLFVASYGGASAATYAWGDAIRTFSGTTRLPSVTLSDIG